jgi:MGT family glycosyltransferase
VEEDMSRSTVRRILALPEGHFLAHVSRLLEIAKALRGMGREVIFAGEGDYLRLPREAGFEVRSLSTMNPEKALGQARKGRVRYHEVEDMRRMVEAELDLYEDLRPDMVMCDDRMTAATSCELAGIPLAVVLNASWTNYYAVRWRAPEHSNFTRILGRKLTTALVPALKRFVLWADSIPVKRYRKSQGLDTSGNTWDFWYGDLNLIADLPEYGPSANLPEGFHYVGPIIWEPEIAAPEWLSRLDSSRPVLYITMGSTGLPAFFHRAVGAFGGTEYQCMVTTARMVDLSGAPRNFHVTDYAPGGKLMARADVVVCHGGNGTIYQALRSGVPIIGIPAHVDQEFNLDRVVDLGVGVKLSERRPSKGDLQAAVRRVLTDPSYRQRARQLAKAFRDHPGAPRAAELICEHGRVSSSEVVPPDRRAAAAG